MQQASGEGESAVAEGQTAVNLNPNSAWSMGAFGHALGWAGHQQEGIEYLRGAMRASPHDPQTWLWTSGWASFKIVQGITKRQLTRCAVSFRSTQDSKPVACCRSWSAWPKERRGEGIKPSRRSLTRAIRLVYSSATPVVSPPGLRPHA
jgi:hypothetical protein